MTRTTPPVSAKRGKKSPPVKPTRSKTPSNASKWRIELTASALRDLKKLDPSTARRILRKLQEYETHPDPLKLAKPVIDAKAGEYRWRVGPYRLMFDRRGRTCFILRISHRKDIYE